MLDELRELFPRNIPPKPSEAGSEEKGGVTERMSFRACEKANDVESIPTWWNGKDVVEAAFCEEFMSSHRLTYDGNAFFTPEGRMTDELSLRRAIYNELKDYAVKNIPHSINNIVYIVN